MIQRDAETSSEAWRVLSGLLNHGPVAVVWHEGRGCVRAEFGTVLELKGDAILSRTYQQGKIVSPGGHVRPGRLCWSDTWTRERAQVAHWPFLDSMLDRIQMWRAFSRHSAHIWQGGTPQPA